ncbi:MAG: AbrB/MazE/SpoVT family DNA-binding domain-containing protein [Anaerolineae bacterium]|nr:AbrB/MazE/SpoVT family DNA-binding domain-containing protein [Anaerolineae bacterium]
MTQPAPSRVVRPLRRGQLTIPVEFRRHLGIDENTLLQLTLREDRIEITPVIASPAKGSAWLRELYDLFAPVRQDAENLAEAEVDALMNDAIEEVRAERR